MSLQAFSCLIYIFLSFLVWALSAYSLQVWRIIGVPALIDTLQVCVNESRWTRDLTRPSIHKREPFPQWDSNPQSQQASGRKTTPRTARPPASAIANLVALFCTLICRITFPVRIYVIYMNKFIGLPDLFAIEYVYLKYRQGYSCPCTLHDGIWRGEGTWDGVVVTLPVGRSRDRFSVVSLDFSVT